MIFKIVIVLLLAELSAINIYSENNMFYGTLTPVEIKSVIQGPITKEGVPFILIEYETKENITLYSNTFLSLNKKVEIEGKIIEKNNGKYKISGKISNINISEFK